MRNPSKRLVAHPQAKAPPLRSSPPLPIVNAGNMNRDASRLKLLSPWNEPAVVRPNDLPGRAEHAPKRPRAQEEINSASDGEEISCRRKRMRLALEERLTRSKSHGLGEKEMSNIKLQALMIETLLFKQQQKKCPESSSSPCKDGSAANDVSIDLQLKTFLTRVQEHRKSLEKSSSTNHLSVQSSTAAVATSPAEHRTLVLRRILGDEQYTRARALMDDIQTVGRGCRLEPGRMPPAVRQLFFATKLVTVWSHTPVSLLEATTTAATWNTYIEQAEEHLRQYRAWVVCNNGSCC